MKKNDITNRISESGFEVVNVLNVWSNGNKIRRFSGQDENSTWHNPKDGYRKMVAVLIEIDGDSE